MAAQADQQTSGWANIDEYAGQTIWHVPGGSYSFEHLCTERVHADINELAKFTYDGHDFISVLFPVWLKKPDTCWMCGIRYTPDTALSDETIEQEQPSKATGIVAFMLLDMLDGGATGWLEALRVHPDHRKQGLARKISSLVNWQAKSKRGCSRVRYTTTTRNQASLKIAHGLGMVETQRWLFIAEPLADTTTDFVQALHALAASTAPDQATLNSSIRSCSTTEAASALAGLQEMHPVLLHDWVARNNTPDTVSQLEALGARFFVSDKDGSVSWCSSRAVYSGDLLHLVGLVAPTATSTAAHMAVHCRLAQQEQRSSLWVFASAAYQQELADLGLSGISGVKNVPQASPICVMVEASFEPTPTQSKDTLDTTAAS